MEPLIHSHITDVLPEGHRLADSNVFCDRCGGILHTWENECMTTWVETGKGNYDLLCFVIAAGGFEAGDLIDPKHNRHLEEEHLWNSSGPGVESLARDWGRGR